MIDCDYGDDGPWGDILLNQLRSIVGPCGSTIILDTGGGSIELTRDGHQILCACRNNDLAWNNLSRFLLKLCINVGDKCGDGTISTSLMLDCLLKEVIARNLKVDSLKRIRFLQAYEVIQCVFNSNKQIITESLINIGIWKSCTISSPPNIGSSLTSIDELCAIKGLMLTTLYPASNSNLANILLSVITSWLRLSNDGKTLSKCHYARTHFDELIICSESASASGQVGDSYPLPLDSIMIENAKCKEVRKLCKVPDKKYLFVCIHSLLTKSNDDKMMTLSLTSLSTLSQKASHRLLYVNTLISYMKERNISVLVSCEEVDDDLYNALTSADIVIIDRVSHSYLQKLAELSKTVVWTNIFDLQIGTNDTNSEKLVHEYGTFDHALMIKTSRFSNHIFIKGIGSSRTTLDHVSQLFLVCNATSMGMLKRMIRRCLKNVMAALNEGRADSGTLVLTPGAGAAEMQWSILFHGISEQLKKYYNHQNITKSNDNNSKQSLIDLIVNKLQQYAEQKYSQSLLREIATVCQHISKAYKTIPRNSINNSMRNRITQRNSNVERLLLEWSTLSNDYPALGYVVNTDDQVMKTGLLCSLQSSFNPENLVTSSGSQFWFIFSTLTEAMRLFLRTGGQCHSIISKSIKLNEKIDEYDDESD